MGSSWKTDDSRIPNVLSNLLCEDHDPILQADRAYGDRSLGLDVHDGVMERIFLLCEGLEGAYEVTFTHSSMVFEFPDDESFKGSSLTKPLFSRGFHLLVVGDEGATFSRSVLKEHVIGCFLREDVDSSLHIPTSSAKTIHELLADVGVGE
jgi:hypothetical protein